jgi:gluconokinase
VTQSVLAFDLGSSAVRAVIFDAGLEPTTTVRHSASIEQDATGAATLDAESYLEAVSACIDELHEQGALAGVTTVAASCQWHSLIPLTGSGLPAGPGLSWMDTRPAPPAELHPADPADFHQRIGAWWHGLYWPARIAWLRRQGASAPRWTGLGGYLALRLLGHEAMSISEASGTGAMDTMLGRWDAEALDLAGLTERAVPPIAPDTWREALTADHARRWPDLAGVPWALPIGDGAASAFGSGCGGPDRLSVTVGTSAAVRLVGHGAVIAPERAWRYRLDHERSVLGIAFSGGGILHDWAERLVGEPSEEELSALRPGEHQLVSLPFHAGHRPPLPADGTGTLHGLRMSTTGTDVMAATLEGVCHELANGARALDPDAVTMAVLSGGAVAASPWLSRRLTAAFGGRALRCVDAEVGARGAAALAAGQDPAPRIERVEVRPSDVDDMTEAGQRHHALRAALGVPQIPRE